jgi:hypothetical protein
MKTVESPSVLSTWLFSFARKQLSAANASVMHKTEGHKNKIIFFNNLLF